MKYVPMLIVTALFTVTATASDDAYPFQQPFQGARAVYTSTNATDRNEILVYRRSDGGDLRLTHRVDTRGRGTGAGLGNQGALALSKNGRRLFAVNAGSNDISVFALGGNRPVLVQKLSSGGEMPISVTLHDELLYVLNAGGAGNIAGFYVGDERRVHAIPNSRRPLSGSASGPAQISFNIFGDVLVVTEKMTHKIVLYDVIDGYAQAPQARDSSGMTPFGFAFDRHDNLIVSEAFGGAVGASATSSYELDGAAYPLEAVSPTVNVGQTAACWVVVTKNGRYAYVTNTGSSTITGFRIARNGALTSLNANGVAARTGSGSMPLDVAASSNGRFLFALSSNVGTISGYHIRDDGSLRFASRVDGIPASASGLVAH